MADRSPDRRTAEQPMYVRLPKDLHEAVKVRSREDERTMAQTIRLALRYYLDKTQPLVEQPG